MANGKGFRIAQEMNIFIDNGIIKKKVEEKLRVFCWRCLPTKKQYRSW